MPASPIPNYLTKKEVEEFYGRSHRSLTRDFSTAVRVGDESVLSHLKIRTEDGRVREGGGITLDTIQELSNQGLTPTWYIESAWAEQRYGSRSKTVKTSKPTQPQNNRPPKTDVPPVPSEGTELVRRLENQINDLQQDKEKLYNELSIKNEQIKQANERTRESNVLMKELQQLLGDVQQHALVADVQHPRVEAGALQTNVVVASSEARQDPAVSPEPKMIPSHEGSTSEKTKPKTPKSKSSSRANRGNTSHRKSGAPTSKSPQAKTRNKSTKKTTPKTQQKSSNIPPTRKHKWYETPTLKRLFSQSK